MSIVHNLVVLTPGCEWSEDLNDHVISELQFMVVSLDLNKPAPAGSLDGCLVVSTTGSVQLDPPDANNFISYFELIENREKYLFPWVDSKCNVIAIQIENEEKLNAIV